MKDMMITHAKDVDGVSPVILLKLLGREVDFYLLETGEVEEKVPLLLKEKIEAYENIYITDLVLSEALYRKISQAPWRERLHIFDHHISGSYAKNYSFAMLDERECATSLFYRYLKEKFRVSSPKVEEYVAHVQNLDLWHWVEREDFVAKQLGDLFELYGNLEYIEHFTKNLENESTPVISDFEEELLKIEDSRIKRYFERKNEQLMFFRYQGYKMGVVYAENYRSELGMLLQKAHPELDFIAMINIGGGVSLRTQKNDVDLAMIASSLGGGGHQKASGFGVLDTKKIDIIKQLFEGAKEEENHENH